MNLEFRIPSSLKNNKEEYNFIKKLEADIGIVVAYGQLLPKEILDLPKKGFINIHASLLPLWRGAAPIERCLMNRDKETGISFMKIAEKLDSGPISNTYSLNILENENAQSLSERLSLLAAEKILNEIDLVLENKAIFKSQEEKKASYAKKISKSEGKIDWNNLAESIIGKINGLYPNPGAWFSFNGQRYKVLEAKIGNKSGNSGVVLDDNLEIGCRDKSIQIITIQREGRTPKKAKEFNNESVGHYPVGNYDGAVIHGQYASVGIEDHTGLEGLEYTFNNQYPTAAATLYDNSALFITTRANYEYVIGDLNQDASINVLDVIITVNIILEQLDFDVTPYQQYVADINQDGTINILDVVLLVELILGS